MHQPRLPNVFLVTVRKNGCSMYVLLIYNSILGSHLQVSVKSSGWSLDIIQIRKSLLSPEKLALRGTTCQ